MITDFEQIQAFWSQLEKTLDKLLESQSDNYFDADRLLDEYRESLQKIDRNLTFHFERDEGEGPVEMVFGCDGYPESIHSVLSLVSMAPSLTGIQFKAFNERCNPVPARVNLGDEICLIDEFWCSLRLIDGKLQLAVYLQDLPEILDLDPRVEAVMIFMDALIGEFELMTRIWSLDWYELPEDPLDFGLFPLEELRERFDAIKEQVKPLGITLH
ncbi:hypothetical protein ADINL_2413 [Nitrincola lacisaponensis]|uniref:Uncharacterized protein n=1 Tax=Nitrincola lacisaponensis TaxID=267850 RepID=A0A063Y0R1_9GAMM|nr:hypothetical protein [Nitrincola lacisaponensis]KDE39284.1 hypothetical protein ADINL_2413 [Nitrincola lacisaponensis]